MSTTQSSANPLYFRPGEVVLLLESVKAADSRRLSRDGAAKLLPSPTRDQMVTALDKAGVKADRQTVLGGGRRSRVWSPTLVRRRTTDYALLSANIAGWMPPERVHTSSPDEMSRLLAGTTEAVQRLNRGKAFQLDGYHLVAAAPNWLAMPFGAL